MKHTPPEQQTRVERQQSLPPPAFAMPRTYDDLERFLRSIQGNPDIRRQWDSAVLRRSKNLAMLEQLVAMLKEHVDQREKWQELNTPLNIGDRYTFSSLLQALGMEADPESTAVETNTGTVRESATRLMNQADSTTERLAA
jgi:hypothetical protein